MAQLRHAAVDRAQAFGLSEHQRFIATDDASAKAALLERKPERASDEAGADDRDLVNGHRASRGYAILRPTAGAMMRSCVISSVNCSG